MIFTRIILTNHYGFFTIFDNIFDYIHQANKRLATTFTKFIFIVIGAAIIMNVNEKYFIIYLAIYKLFKNTIKNAIKL